MGQHQMLCTNPSGWNQLLFPYPQTLSPCHSRPSPNALSEASMEPAFFFSKKEESKIFPEVEKDISTLMERRKSWLAETPCIVLAIPATKHALLNICKEQNMVHTENSSTAVSTPWVSARTTEIKTMESRLGPQWWPLHCCSFALSN